MSKWFVLFLASFLTLGIAACDSDDGPMEEAGEEMDDAIDGMSDAMDDAMDDMEDALD